jgi:hypothetical protein
MEQQQNQEQPQARAEDAFERDNRLTKTLIWIGVAGLGAALAFTLIRSMAARRTDDPTTQRIQQLIDEANQLLKSLDDRRTA